MTDTAGCSLISKYILSFAYTETDTHTHIHHAYKRIHKYYEKLLFGVGGELSIKYFEFSHNID